MRTILFSACYLSEPGRMARNLKYLEYYSKIKSELGYTEIRFVDNASKKEELLQLNPAFVIQLDDSKVVGMIEGPRPTGDLYISSYSEHLPRTGVWQYPYCWRAIVWLQNFLKNNPDVDKVITIDTDFYVLTPRLAHYMRDLQSGWVSFYCHQYGFPEAAMHVLCKDSFDRLINLSIPSYTHYNGQHMELLLPFTHVDKTEFKGGRYGETEQAQHAVSDYYGQWSTGCPEMVYNLKGE